MFPSTAYCTGVKLSGEIEVPPPSALVKTSNANPTLPGAPALTFSIESLSQ